MKRRIFQLAVVLPPWTLLGLAYAERIRLLWGLLALIPMVSIIAVDIYHKDYGRGYGLFEPPPSLPAE